MRFLLKTAFWLALIAFFLPSPTPEDPNQPGVNYFGAFLGAQEAISDMGGFCERAPTACAAGRDVGSFVAARVGDGIAYAYAAVQGETAPPAAAPAAPTVVTVRAAPPAIERAASARAVSAPSPDPMQTAAVAAEHVRRAAGLPPFGMPGVRDAGETAFAPRPAGLVPEGAPLLPPPPSPAIPTPAPRV